MILSKLMVIVSVSAMVLVSCTSTHQSIDRNVRLFDELAFGGPLDNDLAQDKTLVKWTGAIRASLMGDGIENFAPEINRQFIHISKLTGLSIQVEDAATTEANFVIKFSATKGYSIRNDFVPCIARLGINAGVIDKAMIEISTANEGKISTCIAHELMHSLGFRYHSGITRSILSPLHGERNFTSWDNLMIATLYNQSLSPGLSRADALSSVRGLIEEATAR